MPLSVSDTFTGGAGVLSDPPWTQTETTFVELNGSGQADVDHTTTGDCLAIWNADTFPDDQLAEVTVGLTLPGDGSAYVQLIVRSGAVPEVGVTRYYFATDGGSDSKLKAVVAGVESVIGSDDGLGVAGGDVLTLQAIGTDITVAKNGVTVITASDATVTSGQPGFGLFSSFGPGVALADSFGATGDGAGAGVHTVSGRGNIAVTSPAWLSTVLSGTIPVFASTGAAEPPNYYHVGMLSWGTSGSGAMAAYPVTRLLDLVELPAGMDTVWYEFAPGVVAVISELATP